MAEDDFQKGSPNDKPNLGLRDAISNARQNNQKLAEERALELFKEMKIIDKVTSAINSGSSSVTISFPASVKKKRPHMLFVGEVKWSDVIDSFSSMIREEIDELQINTAGGGGCCKEPGCHTYPENRRRHLKYECYNCGKTFTEYKYHDIYDAIYLEF